MTMFHPLPFLRQIISDSRNKRKLPTYFGASEMDNVITMHTVNRIFQKIMCLAFGQIWELYPNVEYSWGYICKETRFCARKC